MDTAGPDRRMQTTTTRGEGTPRVPLPRAPGRRLVGIGSEYSLSNVGWKHYNTLYQMLDYASSWPPGMAAHVAWPSGGVGRAIYLWDSRESMESYFANVVADRIAKAISLLGAVQGPEGPVDIEPVLSAVMGFTLGPRARDFCDIGPDADGSAITRGGGTPVIVQLEMGEFDSGLGHLLDDELGSSSSVPSELILRSVHERDGHWRAAEVWTGIDSAVAALEGETLPAITRIAKSKGIELSPSFTIDEPTRIVIDSGAASEFGF